VGKKDYKVKNYDAVKKAILQFSVYLMASVVMAICFFFCFIKTSSVEVSRIIEKAGEYDRIRATQLDLTEKMDTLYHYASMLRSESGINYKLMQNALSNRKIQFSNVLSGISDKDCRLYKKLALEINVIFDTKDSIIITKSELNSVREDLIRCVADNRKVTRKISTGGLTFEK
jgi:regulatory protein YycH of two-component signal transduction system YycFG